MFKKDIFMEKNNSFGLCGVKIRHQETQQIVSKKINRKLVGAQLI